VVEEIEKREGQVRMGGDIQTFWVEGTMGIFEIKLRGVIL